MGDLAGRLITMLEMSHLKRLKCRSVGLRACGLSHLSKIDSSALEMMHLGLNSKNDDESCENKFGSDQFRLLTKFPLRSKMELSVPGLRGGMRMAMRRYYLNDAREVSLSLMPTLWKLKTGETEFWSLDDLEKKEIPSRMKEKDGENALNFKKR